MILLSIITINYNNKQGLADTFESVFSQNHLDFEYIVIDGGSTDGSKALIENFSDKISYYVSESDDGIYDAMNKGINAASGEYLIFMNSGDCFNDTGTLERCLQYLSAFPSADILYADIYMISNRSAEPVLYTHPATLNIEYFKNYVLNQQASLFKSSLFKELGLFPFQYKLAGDYWLYLKSFLADKLFIYMDFIMVRYDFTGLSFTNGGAYRQEQFSIWKDLVPEPLRRTIDQHETPPKSGVFKIIRRFRTMLKSLFYFKKNI